jgi:hypothetical protein
MQAVQNAGFATDLSDAGWAFFEPMLPKPAQNGPTTDSASPVSSNWFRTPVD